MILYEVQPGPYFRRCRITPTHPHTSFARPPCTRITSVPSLPLHCSVTYKASPFQGHGTICNLSMNDWRLSGDLPAQTAGTLSLRVRFPNEQCIEFPQAVIRGARGQEFAGPATVPFSRRQGEALAQTKIGHLVRCGARCAAGSLFRHMCGITAWR
jgi:hypothetical protein